jgi:DNA polymerase-3 subunit beta
MAIETSALESEVLEEGSVALDIKVFADIVRGLPGPNIEISVDDKNLTTIKSGRSEFKILGMNPEEFPALPKVSKSQAYKISSAVFKNMIRQTVFSVSQDASKPVLCGQLLDIKEDNIKMVSVDGFRISLRSWTLESSGENSNLDVKMVVPGKTMSELSKILPADSDTMLDFYYTSQHVLFDLGSCVAVSRLLDGEFINYENMFVSEATTAITLNRNEAMESIERATLISRDSKKSPVKLKIENSTVAISSNTEMGASYEEVAALQDGPDLEIAFNPRYLTDVMKVLDAEKITMSFTSSLSPCIIKVEGSEDYKYLVLPLRLRA